MDEPDLRPTPELVETLTAGLAEAIDEAVSTSSVARPFVVEYRLGDEAHLPGWLRIGPDSFRDQMRRFSSTDGDAVSQLWKGEDSGIVARVDLSGFCDPDTLRACREINTALSLTRDFKDPDQQRARTALGALGARLAADLNREGRYPGVADPFLVLVEVGDPYGDTDGIERARSAIGRERVERFVASLATQVAATATPVDEVRHDRTALAAWLTQRGLAEHADRIAQAAQHSLRLAPAPDANTRLGGDGLLPAGAEWPRTSAGRPLAFLAGLDLAELPTHGRLPDAGWLLFFADLDDQGEALGFIGEPTLNAPGADAQVLWTAEPPAAAEPPADLPDEPHIRSGELRVAPRPQLTLEDGYDSGEALGLDPAQAQAYDELAESLRGYDEGDDWVLGAVTGVQGEPPEEGTVLLLHLASIEFQDAGAIQFRIPEAALKARDWSQICAEGDSA